MYEFEATKRLIQHMHDRLCQCGGWCQGAADDFEAFQGWVSQRWGFTYGVEEYLEELHDGLTWTERDALIRDFNREPGGLNG